MRITVQFSHFNTLAMCRRAGFVYQYYEGLEQDLQGELNITEEIINNNVFQQVSDGMCQDFFEFREVQLVT